MSRHKTGLHQTVRINGGEPTRDSAPSTLRERIVRIDTIPGRRRKRAHECLMHRPQAASACPLNGDARLPARLTI